MEPGPVLLRRFVRNKNKAICDEVELLDANHSFARVGYPDGRESIVSTTDLAQSPNGGKDDYPAIDHDQSPSTSNADTTIADELGTTRQTDLHENDLYEVPIGEKSSSTPSEGLRRSNRERKPPERCGDWA